MIVRTCSDSAVDRCHLNVDPDTLVVDALHPSRDADSNGSRYQIMTRAIKAAQAANRASTRARGSGTVENQGRFYDRFDHVVLITAPLHVLVERVNRRTNNPHRKTPQQRAVITRYVETVEPLLRRGATLELDGQRPLSELPDAIESLSKRTS